jgi:hypothetical protein
MQRFGSIAGSRRSPARARNNVGVPGDRGLYNFPGSWSFVERGETVVFTCHRKPGACAGPNREDHPEGGGMNNVPVGLEADPKFVASSGLAPTTVPATCSVCSASSQ